MKKVILHCDLNNFYASVECLYNPKIRNHPVAVCGSKKDRHGIVLAKNYIAKKFKIRTGEATWEAQKKCPNLIVVPPNYSLYLNISNTVKNIYKYYTNQIEPFGIDESWLDVTGSIGLFGNGLDIAHEIIKRIKNELGITASVGVSYNKIFAKLGSDMKKPDAVTLISKENYKNIVWPLPICDLLYIGPSTWKKCVKIGIITIGDLANTPESFLSSKFGKWGTTLWNFANGFDLSEVATFDYDFPVKGIGNSITSPRDLLNDEDVKIFIFMLTEAVSKRLRSNNMNAKTVQLWIKDTKLKGFIRQGTLDNPVNSFSEISKKTLEIFENSWIWPNPIRAMGIRATNLSTADTYIQLSLFEDENIKNALLDSCIDNIQNRFGNEKIKRAIMLIDKKLKSTKFDANRIHPISFFR